MCSAPVCGILCGQKQSLAGLIRRGFSVFSHPAFLLDEQHENRAEPPAPWDAIKEYGLCGTLLLTFQQPCGLVRPFRFTLALISVTDGEIHLLGKARGSKMGNNLLVQEIDKAGGIDFSMPVLLGYSGISDALLLKYIEDSRHIWEGKLKEIRYTTVGSVIGTHAGPGAVVVAFFKNQYNAEQNSSD